MKKEQNVVGRQAAPGEYFDGEEIDTGKDSHVRGDELLPGAIGLPFQSWRNAIPAQNVADRLIRDAVPQIRECSDDAVVTPTRILSGHLKHQLHNFR